MDAPPVPSLRPFRASSATDRLDPEFLTSVVLAGGDLGLILGPEGTIEDVALRNPAVWEGIPEAWSGRTWADTVAPDSKDKVRRLVAQADVRPCDTACSEINQLGPDRSLIPVAYEVIRLPRTERLLAVGRDLQPMATLQQRLVAIQQTTDREYGRTRQAEARFRHVYQVCSEAMLLVDRASLQIRECNPAAQRLLVDVDAVGQTLTGLIDPEHRPTVLAALSSLPAIQRRDGLAVRLKTKEPVVLSASLLRNEDGPLLLVRLVQSLATGLAQLSHLVGRVHLKQIIRETTECIEALCIETALELTGDNRASAAQLLGLSRQSLYSKLHRHGLLEATPNRAREGLKPQ